MENNRLTIIVNSIEHKVSLETIKLNFAVSEHYEVTDCDVGEGGQRGYETLEEYIELLQSGNYADDFNFHWGTKYYLANFGDNLEGLQRVIQFCKDNGIDVETHERTHRP